MNVRKIAFSVLLSTLCFIPSQVMGYENFDEMYSDIRGYLKKPTSKISDDQYNYLASIIADEKDLCMKWIEKGDSIKEYRKNTADCLYKSTMLVFAIDRARGGSNEYGKTIEDIYKAMLKEAETEKNTIPSGVKEAIASSVFVIYAPAITKISRERWREGYSDEQYRRFFIKEYEAFTHHKMPKDLLDKLNVRE